MAFKSPILQGSARLDSAAKGPPSVKKGPPHDDAGAVQRIQNALVELGYEMPISFAKGEADGIFGQETFNKVQDFQKWAFPSSPSEWDGRVGLKTLQTMDDLLAGDGRFIGFNGEQIDMLEADLARAQKFIAVVRNKMSSTIRPGSVDADTETKLNNIFHMNLDATDPFTLSFRRVEILQNVSVIERGLKQIFPFQGEPANALGRAAFVSNDFHDQTMHIQENYFDLHQDDRAVTLIHERAHTVLKASGHPGSGDVLFCVVPDQGITAPPIAYSDAIRNAYCYELISLALQPDYNPARFRQNPQCLPLSMTGG